MAGTKAGGIKASKTIRKSRPDFYKIIGREGGKVKTKKGFGKNPDLARIAGAMGGTKSKRRSY